MARSPGKGKDTAETAAVVLRAGCWRWTLEGAGGIRGLLARSVNGGSHAYYHADGNGNITAMVNASQAVVGRYTYDPFGRTVSSSGTVAPTAALAAMPYTPHESLAALKHYYHTLGNRLWGDFGFRDAFHLDRNWFERGYLAIDQGPIVVMIEHHRSALCWRLFMANEEIPRALRASGWTQP